jgi:hypothetical protein
MKCGTHELKKWNPCLNKFKSMLLVYSINCQLMNKIANHFPTMPINNAPLGWSIFIDLPVPGLRDPRVCQGGGPAVYIPTASFLHPQPQSTRAHAQTRGGEKLPLPTTAKEGIPEGGGTHRRPSAGMLAADVSSVARLLRGEAAKKGGPEIVTMDLLGGCGGGVAAEDEVVDLDVTVPAGWERRLDLLVS